MSNAVLLCLSCICYYLIAASTVDRDDTVSPPPPLLLAGSLAHDVGCKCLHVMSVIKHIGCCPAPPGALISRDQHFNIMREAQHERRDLPCTYLAHHEPAGVLIIIMIREAQTDAATRVKMVQTAVPGAAGTVCKGKAVALLHKISLLVPIDRNPQRMLHKQAMYNVL